MRYIAKPAQFLSVMWCVFLSLSVCLSVRVCRVRPMKYRSLPAQLSFSLSLHAVAAQRYYRRRFIQSCRRLNDCRAHKTQQK